MSGPTVISELPQAAGWYGKIPALGDFASRRLSRQFIDAWDEWLQRAISKSRDQLGPDWLDHYLSSPVWRFAMLPGLCGDGCWAGIVMPSVDNVGRHFPLVIAAPLPSQPGMLEWLMTDHGWFEAIEEAALSCLDLTFPVEALEARLARAGCPIRDADASPARLAGAALAGWWHETSGAPFQATLPGCQCVGLLNAASQCLMSDAGHGKSLWWRLDDADGTMQLHAFRGLPPDDCFINLLDRQAPAPDPGGQAGPGST